MDLTLPQRLQDYIDSEMHHEALYRAMAEKAPTEHDRQLLLEIAENERNHADEFKGIYQAAVGQSYEPEIVPPDMEAPYQIVLRQMIIYENAAFQEYHNQFITSKDPVLKKTCYQTGKNKSDHINKLIKLMVD
ncbi:MAG TPA: ferritin-like domain-containing protein [Clostridia bacterium]|nr:ferritin-like domain-containing protein [Clostridia bacterium]